MRPLLVLAVQICRVGLGTHQPALGIHQLPLGMVAAVAAAPHAVPLLLQLWLSLVAAESLLLAHALSLLLQLKLCQLLL